MWLCKQHAFLACTKPWVPLPAQEVLFTPAVSTLGEQKLEDQEKFKVILWYVMILRSAEIYKTC